MAEKKTVKKKAVAKKTSVKSGSKPRSKSRVKKITKKALVEKIKDINIPDEELAQYFKLDQNSSEGFAPNVVIDESLIEDDGLEGASLLNGANGIAKWRRNRTFSKRIKGWTGVKVVAEGDSWFQYPFLLKDTIDQLNDRKHFEYAIYGLSEAGDLLSNIIKEDELTGAIQKYNPDVFLISGGGNDMVGNERMAKMVHSFSQGKKASDYPNQQFAEFLHQIGELYKGLFQRLISRFPHLKIVCHGYDRVIPDNGKWLGKPLASKGIREKSLQAGIVAEMIEQFNSSLEDISQAFPGRVYYADCRGLVGSKSNWHDELHPKNAGYFKVARLFDETIKRALSDSPPVAELSTGAVYTNPAFEGSPKLMTNVSELSASEFVKLVTKRAQATLTSPVEAPTSDDERRSLEIQLEKIHQTADFLPSRFLELGVQRAQAVCRILIRSALGRGFGTGFLIGTRNFIMTNNHVLPDRETATGSIAEFDYDQDNIEYEVRLLPEQFFITHEVLDFTIVACDPSPLPSTIVPISFPTDPYTVTRNERVNIIQHPKGRRKEVSIHDNLVTYVYDKVIRYRTDTEGGSSGSPVLNNDWVLSALHHAGVKNDDGTATNEGIKISSILNYLRSLNQNEVDSVIDKILAGESDTSVVDTASANRGVGRVVNQESGLTINLSGKGALTINF